MNLTAAYARSRKRDLYAVLGLCLLTAFVYSNSFQAGFVLDNAFILQQDRFHHVTLHNIGLILGHTYWWPMAENGLYRPFTSLSYLFNYAVLGNADRPGGYHWVNSGLQMANTILAYFVSLRLIRRFRPAFFVAAVWAVHPLLTESVTNIVGRADLLSAMAVLSGFLMYLKAAEAEGKPRAAWFAGLAAVTIVGLFSKESSIAIVAVIFLYKVVWWQRKVSVRNLVDGLMAMSTPLIVFLYQRSIVVGAARPASVAFADNPLAGANFLTARLTAIEVMFRYLVLVVFPAKLSIDYSWPQIPLASGGWRDWIAIIAVAGLIFWLALLFRRERTAFFFGSFALLTFLPTSNLLFPIGTIMAERLLYLPSLGLIACLVLGVFSLSERIRMPGLAPVVLCLIIPALGARAWIRNRDWRDDLTLAQSAVQTAPKSFKSHLLLAEALFRAKNIDGAVSEAERSLAILEPLPDSKNVWSAYRQAAVFYLEQGDRLQNANAYRRSVQLLRRAAAIVAAFPEPASPSGGLVLQHGASECYQVLSTAYLRLSDTDDAYAAAARARDLDPSAPAAWRALGAALAASARNDEEIETLMEGQLLTGDPGFTADVLAAYQREPDGPGCAASRGVDGPQISISCAEVHRPLCKAATNAVKFLVQTARPNMAQISANRAVREFGCEAGPFDEVLLETRKQE